MSEDDGLLQHIAELRTTLAGAPRALAALLEGRATVDAHDSAPAGAAELRAARRQLADGRALLQGIFDATREAMLLVDDRGTYVDANDAACELFGVERDLVLGRNVGELRLVDTEIHRVWADFVDGGAFAHDVSFVRARDDRRSLRIHGLSNVLPGIHLLVMRDDTETRRMASRYHAIIEKSRDGTLLFGPDLDVVYASPSAEHILGRSASELRRERLTFVADGDREDLERTLGEVANEPLAPRTFELLAVHPDGTTHWVEATATSFLHDADVGAIVASLRDVTERRKNDASLRRAEEELRQLQKMDAIGALAGGVAHDFNNLLSIILSYANLVLDEAEKGSQLHADVEEIRRAGERSSDLTRQLLAFSRQQVLHPQVLDLGLVVSGMEKMLKRLLGEDIELIIESSRVLGRVLADPSQLEQVVLNLAVNARDAMPRGGKLILETRNFALDEIDADGFGDPEAIGPHVMLAATDTGVGMDEKTRARIFEPFFTTKDPGKGTGLGLSTVFGIVKQSRGHVRVDSQVDIGTRFEIFFPQTAQPFRTMTSVPVSSGDRGTETILVVEDEAQVRIAICAILRRHGYRVLDAENAGEALLLVEQHGKPIQLLLTDIVLPRLAGTELAERLMQSHPGLKVLFMSGYAAGAAQERIMMLGDAAFLPKPIVPKTLLRKVREVLATPMIRYV